MTGALPLVLPGTPAQAQELRLEADTPVATAGFYQLKWQAPGPVVLEEDDSPSFASPRIIYRGVDAARVMSGQRDGERYYRIKDEGGSLSSNIVKVTVQHHSLARAFSFFSLGATVFVSTLLLIGLGARTRD